MSFLERIAESINDQSLQAKLGILILLIVIICGVYWYFFWSPNANELERLEVKLRQTEKKLQEYEAIAKELPEFQKEFKRLNKEFQIASAKLPKDKEIPSLIDNVYAELSASGLEPIVFEPKGEVNKDIYAEIPINMEVTGSYYDLANFFDRISRLPRIVNVRQLDLKRNAIRGNKPILGAKFNVVTFRLLPASKNLDGNADDKKK